MAYIDLNTSTVASAGRATAGTSNEWQGWGQQAETALRDAALIVREAVITGAIQNYACDWNPKIKGLAIQVDALGRNTTSASNVMLNADGTAVTHLAVTGATASANSSSLSRPITV